MPFGYHGRWLEVDLQTASAQEHELSKEVLCQYIGGVGLGVWLMLQLEAWRWAALEPEAPLALVFSPLVSSPLTTSAKFAVVGRSPLTNRINDSLASSTFALVGKQTGYDALVLRGAARELSLVVVEPQGVQVIPVPELAGCSCEQTQAEVRRRLGPEFAVLAVGPAGERGIAFATLSHQGRHAGRGGSGAVLGAKGVKALAVRGQQRVRWARPKVLTQLARKLAQLAQGPQTAKYRQLGTLANMAVFNRLGLLPAENFQKGSSPAATALSVEQLQPQTLQVRESCQVCNIGCDHRYTLQEDQPGVRLEYESAYALGPLCGISDPQTVLWAARFCDHWGLDTISTGATVAFAMECVQRGWLKEPWLQFGRPEALRRALELMVRRQGVGELLALGTRAMAEQLGPEALAIAPQVKGLELPGYELRRLPAAALAMAVATRGADHNRTSAYEVDFSPQPPENDNELVQRLIWHEDRAAVMDSLILCKFLRGVFEDFFASASEMLWATTGWHFTAGGLHQVARRIITARKLFNILCGWQPQEDTLPERFFTQGTSTAGPLSRQRFERLKRLYYLQRGWTPEGWIPWQQLEHLGLAQFGLLCTQEAETSEPLGS